MIEIHKVHFVDLGRNHQKFKDEENLDPSTPRVNGISNGYFSYISSPLLKGHETFPGAVGFPSKLEYSSHHANDVRKLTKSMWGLLKWPYSLFINTCMIACWPA